MLHDSSKKNKYSQRKIRNSIKLYFQCPISYNLYEYIIKIIANFYYNQVLIKTTMHPVNQVYQNVTNMKK